MAGPQGAALLTSVGSLGMREGTGGSGGIRWVWARLYAVASSPCGAHGSLPCSPGCWANGTTSPGTRPLKALGEPVVSSGNLGETWKLGLRGDKVVGCGKAVADLGDPREQDGCEQLMGDRRLPEWGNH